MTKKTQKTKNMKLHIRQNYRNKTCKGKRYSSVYGNRSAGHMFHRNLWFL